MLTFQLGDIVVLKSGSPAMTVVEASPSEVKCRWFHKVNGAFSVNTFLAGELEKIDDYDSRIIDVHCPAFLKS